MPTTDFVEGEADGTTNGTTPVTVVATPGASVRRIAKTVTVTNVDTAAAVVVLEKVSSGGTRRLARVPLEPDEHLIWDAPEAVRSSTSSLIQVRLEGAVTSDELDWTSTWGDAS